MPITLTFTEGVLPVAKAKEAIAQITASFLKHHGMTGNTVMTRNLTAHVHVVPKGLTFSGGKEIDAAWIETRSPSFALADHKIQVDFFTEVTKIVHDLSGGKLPKEHIWASAVHTVDGTWNIDGVPLTNAGVIEAVSKS